ncbi:MAG: FAD-dependent oxidoreductase [Myxococcota bacterium]
MRNRLAQKLSGTFPFFSPEHHKTPQKVPHTHSATRSRAPEGHRIAIIGGGLAGLAAATVLAERGVEVEVFEKEEVLGGRLGAWKDELKDGTQFSMERGFHAFFRQYYNLRALMRRFNGEESLVPMQDYPLIAPGGMTQSFSGIPKQTPFNFLSLMWRTPTLTLRDLLRIRSDRALAMLQFDPETTYARFDHMSARDYLDGLRFPPDARRMLFDVFSHSFFNPEPHYSAAELLAMFHFYFVGNPEGLVFDVLDKPFDRAIFGPLQRYLEALNVQIRAGETVQQLEKTQSGFQAVTTRGKKNYDGIVLALHVDGLKRLIDDSPGLASDHLVRSVNSLEVTWPFAVLRLWTDRPCDPSRAPFAGTADAGILDNISLFERLEDESRKWSHARGGSVVELHAYGVDPSRAPASIREELLERCRQLYPELREAIIHDERLIIRRDCPAFQPGSHRHRPSVESGIDGLMLAGDFVRMPFPCALMERAVASGMMAANQLLRRLEVKEEALFSVPPRGMLAGMVRAA